MQQFTLFAVALALFCSTAGAQTADDPCASRVILGDIDLSKPITEASAEPKPAPGFTALIPIETALPGLANTPRAFAGAVSVAVPRLGPADLPAECQPNLLRSIDKPVAPE
ncbi:MAG: hypothetical protein AAF221_05520 [Pseudomonadota bacterium]